MEDPAYYLSAVIGRKAGSFEVRTTAFSPENLDALLKDDPAAITVAPEGALVPERLLDLFSKQEALLRDVLRSPAPRGLRSHRWRYYAKHSYDLTPHVIRSIDSDDMKQHLFQAWGRMHNVSFAFVREGPLTEAHPPSNIDSAIADAMKPRRTQIRLTTAPSEKLAAANRQALHAARQDMLKRIETYTSEELASALDSANGNPSQFAADKRKSNRIFGVRLGREWHYPQFQFDRTRKPLEPFAEMKDVLAALAPDVRGWDRLQWFLEPHLVLNEQTPLEVWSQDRAKVVEAARTERWDARD
jgi:hypothetical protein